MSKMANGQAIIQAFESWSPKSLAVEGDKVGLQVGTLNKPVRKVMVALDVLEDVIDEAIHEEVDLIIAHHPLIFRPLKNIMTDRAHGRIVEKAIKNDITIYAAHTNLDVANGGVNDLMAEALGLEDTEVLAPTTSVPLKKVVIFVPHSHADQVRQAIGNAGGGHIGNYSHCTYNSEGTGTFVPGAGTDPYIGEQGKMEFVDEVKVESIVPVDLQNKVVRAMINAHPYEEPAYDIYPLDNQGETLGLGRIGKLKNDMTLQQFAEHVKAAFSVKGARVVGDLEEKVKKVAVLGGDGNKYMTQAMMKGADVFVTGDVYYHVAHDAMMDGLNIVDPGHNVEKVMKEGVKQFLEGVVKEKKYKTEVIASQVHTDPFTFL
ncbi:Nif3-like dinuclear metal center hexameric protein [Desertibacillus haloalkaliphilus]|uniref:Nif3-like dinuclear metal center hexameric protein n=1 Tax=Desertibacillus haloalkaliphilus TaxID=1328930 RepID=UPI001C273EBA|nr:Nif3-like dinuclear metal center hexameric protein [Desertibacillus haloalkaliphilus]MBU8905684.1 Nif3-like dinuclear metal center hexameric protein [Desertibacillus haloalkaliphilus]